MAIRAPRTRRPLLLRARGDRGLLAALASGFVGALALASSIYNVYLQRQQVRAQVFPSLEWRVHWTSSDNTWSLVVSNRGVGPAVVSRARVRVDGHPVPTWLAVQKALVPGGAASLGVTHDIEGTLSPGLDETAFALNEPETAFAMFRERRRLAIELCYCSTLDDCWTVGGSGTHSDAPVPVPACDASPDRFTGFDEAAFDELAKQLAASMKDAGPPAKAHD